MKAIKYFIFCILLSFSFISEASHMMGAEITYQWLGNKKYLVTAKVYRDCRGIPLNSPSFNVSDYNGKTVALSYTRTSIEDITLVCSDTISKPCYPSNSTVSNEGIELHTFVATVDFGAAPYNTFPNNNICQVYFSLEQCCRNGAITTLNQGNLYVDAMLDICNSKYQNTSPQFISRNVMKAFCNQPFSQNFGSKDYIDYDSLGYELATPLNGPNSQETYQGSFSSSIPMTPYCVTAGIINCKPLPTAKPPRGFYFDKLTGDIVFTPANCSEVGVISVKVSEYRKDSTNKKWLLVGYVLRDIQIGVGVGSSYNAAPTATLASTYNFRTRTNQCIDIKSFDTAVAGASSSNKGDRTNMAIRELPSGATFRYVDSSAKHKTGRFCWQIHDSVYLKFKNKNKLLPVTLEVWDNFCDVPSLVQKSFSIKILPPDSSGFLSIKTYSDLNKNNFKDTLENELPLLLKFKDKNSAYYIETNEKGLLEDSMGIGKVTIGPASHPYFTSTTKDTNLLVKMDSAHHLKFGVYLKNGIYGRIYEDANSNCKFDKGELPLAGFKVFTDSNKYIGISDNNGIYFINAPKGKYNLFCDYKPAILTVNCPPSKIISISISGDSAYQYNDFGISKNMKYMDVSTEINLLRLRRGSVSSVTFYCFNNGPTTRKNIKLYCPVNSKFDLTYNSTLFASAGSTAVIKVDSIQPYKYFSIKLDFYVSPTGFKSGDRLCFSLATDSTTKTQDSLKSNNDAQECRTVDAPYDPNEKLVSVDSFKTTLDKTIAYTVHFQNSGTDTATRVIVSDTIDNGYLDLSKFEMNWSDFPCEPIISGNVLHFIFNNINLPHFAKGGDKSMAGFKFTLGLKSNVTSETSFSNKASIYFDFENPVVTKKAIATISSPIVLSKVKFPTICINEKNRVFFNSNIVLNTDNKMILELSDMNGLFSSPTILKTIATNSLNDSIDFSVPTSFNAGIYSIRIRSTSPPSISIPASGIIKFKILAKPSYLVNSNLNNNRFCEKDTLKLSFTNSSYLYKILKNKSALSNFSTTRAYEFPIAMNDSFQIICLDNTTNCKDTTAIYPIILKKPVVSSFIVNRKKIYCSGEQIELNAAGGKYYIFTKDNGILGNKTTISTFKTNLDIPSSYRVIAEDSNGCSNQSDTLLVNVNPSPVATLSSQPNPICLGDSVTLVYGNGLTYDLFKNNVLLLSKTTVSSYRLNNPVDGDKYKITAISDKGCSNTSIELTIIVNPVPAKPVILQNKNDLSVSFTGKIKWYRNGLLITNTSNTITDAPGGIYAVEVTNPEGCSNTSDGVIHQNTLINSLSDNQFKIYPNPASQEITVENADGLSAFNLKIYDMSGRLVYHSENNLNTVHVNIEGFGDGLYSLKLETNGNCIHSRMISIIK